MTAVEVVAALEKAVQACEQTQGADKPYELYMDFRAELAKAAHPDALRTLLDAHASALTQVEYWKQIARDCRPYVEELQGRDGMGYGFYRPENPNDFTPDHESCTEEEIANHRAACEAYDAGTYKREESGGWISPDVHILTAPWGIGSYVVRDSKAEEILCAIGRAALDDNTKGAAE